MSRSCRAACRPPKLRPPRDVRPGCSHCTTCRRILSSKLLHSAGVQLPALREQLAITRIESIFETSRLANPPDSAGRERVGPGQQHRGRFLSQADRWRSRDGDVLSAGQVGYRHRPRHVRRALECHRHGVGGPVDHLDVLGRHAGRGRRLGARRDSENEENGDGGPQP